MVILFNLVNIPYYLNKFQKIFNPLLDDQVGKKNRKLLGIGIICAILISIALPLTGIVVLKMLPFDNKSEFQVILDMPPNTRIEGTSNVLKEMGEAISKLPEVSNYQIYAGTSAPINFNGLVRQYYFRQSPALGDIQVNLVDKHHRSDKSHTIAREVMAQRTIRVETLKKAKGTLKICEIHSRKKSSIFDPQFVDKTIIQRRKKSNPW